MRWNPYLGTCHLLGLLFVHSAFSSINFVNYFFSLPFDTQAILLHPDEPVHESGFKLVAVLSARMEQHLCFHQNLTYFLYASGRFSCGAVVPNGDWFNLQWPSEWSSVDIVVKELVPLVLTGFLCGPFWSAQNVLFHVDNMAVVQVVQHLNASDPRLCQLFC